MNIHVSQAIKDKWPSHDFRGKPKLSRHGFIYIEAYHRVLRQTFFYVFDADSFIDIDGLKHGASELIFDNTMAL
jgi:hypothetical protein